MQDKLSIAVIGCGNMGSALVRGWCRNSSCPNFCFKLFDADIAKAQALAREVAHLAASRLGEAVQDVEIVLLAVKPKQAAEVVGAIAAAAASAKTTPLLISIAAGVSCSELSQWAGPSMPVARVMPNLSCMVGQGISGIFAADDRNRQLVQSLFSQVGLAEVVGSEAELDGVTAISGCGPGFMCLVIEALADGGVKAGLSRERAMRLAAQTVCGTGALVAQSGLHPAQIKDMVSSPGGATIAGLHVLEQCGLRAALISALEASVRRTQELLKK